MFDVVQVGPGRHTTVPAVDAAVRSAVVGAPPRSLIRRFEPDDLAAVAALFIRLFRKAGPGDRSPDLERCLREVLFRPERPSTMPAGLVSVGAAGLVQGFVACSAQPMRLGGRRVMGLNGGTLMLDPAHRGDATVLIRLLRAFFDAPHDVSFTDTANPVSRALLEKLGATFLPIQSIDWIIVRSRAGLVLRVGLDRVRAAALDRALGAALRAWTGWSAAARPAARRRAVADFVAVPIAELAEAIVSLAAGYPLRPAWDDDPAPLLFRLGEAAKLRRHGPLQWQVAYDASGEPIGCWIAYLRPGGVGRALQVLARPGRAEAVFADLVAAADRQGCAAIRGRLQPDLLPALTRLRTFYLPRLATLIRTNDPTLLPDCLAVPALLTGLAGETWSRIFEDEFAMVRAP